jgi:hypothetical protein
MVNNITNHNNKNHSSVSISNVILLTITDRDRGVVLIVVVGNIVDHY